MSDLTLQQLRYGQARRSGMGMVEAAIEAGYSAKTAAVKASQLEKLAGMAEVIAGVPSASPPPMLADYDAEEVARRDPLNGQTFDDSLEFLRAAMNSTKVAFTARLRAAEVLAPYEHSRKGEMGKKEMKAAAAAEAGKGKYATPPPPPNTGVVTPIRRPAAG